jgi:hypothetical protein
VYVCIALVIANIYIEQIYHVWEGYFRKIPVKRWTISRAKRREKFCFKTRIFHRQIHSEYFFFIFIHKVTWYIKFESRKCSDVKDLTCLPSRLSNRQIHSEYQEYFVFIVCNLPIVKHYRTLWTVPFSRNSGSISICYVRQWLKYSEWIWRCVLNNILYN